LDLQTAETRYRAESTGELGPDEWFDKNWATALLESALRQLETEVRAAGKEPLFRALAPCLMGDELDERYAEIGRRLALSEAAVKMAVVRLRQRFRRLIRLELEQTVASAEEAEAEFRHLAEALRGRE
jgi:RNA polymerase sigma-70 factor (ECF subfamily)